MQNRTLVDDQLIPPVIDMPNRNWDSFRYFLAVARTGSITAAARTLSESQPTVGRKIKELETALGARLVERGAAGVCLSDCGRRVLGHVESMEHATRTIGRMILGSDDQLAGRVVIAVPEGFGVAVVAPQLCTMRERYPDIDVELLIGTSKVNLVNRDADIAVRIGDPLHPSLIGRKLGEAAFSLFAHPKYIDARGAPATPAELDDHDIVDMAHDLQSLVQSVRLRKLAPNARRVLRFNSVAAQAQAVREGFGIGALPRYLATNDNDLVEVLPGEFDASQDLWILRHEELRDVARIDALTGFLTGIARQALSK